MTVAQMRVLGHTVYWLLASAMALLALISVALLLWFITHGDQAETVLIGEFPTQFYQALDSDLFDDYGAVFSVAHNAGDDPRIAREALEHDGDVIEIDVISNNGQLYAAHHRAIPVIERRTFRGPTLEEMWRIAALGDAIALDLKESSATYLARVAAMIQEHPDDQVIVMAREPASLHYLAEHAPGAIRILSINKTSVINELQRDARLTEDIDGVTMRADLVTNDVGEWLQQQDLLLFTWVVNDVARMNELVRLGADAITTDNLAIMQVLGTTRNNERRLSHRDD